MPDGGGRSDADADAVNAIQRERERAAGQFLIRSPIRGWGGRRRKLRWNQSMP